jgi:hypothetical protein
MAEILMAGALIVGGVFFLVACLLPIVSEPGKDGWNDVE